MTHPPSPPDDPAEAPVPDIAALLTAWRGGDAEALKALTPLVYEELRKLAQRYMRRERTDHTLQPTAVVNEAFVRLLDMQVEFQDRTHFFAIAASLMRRILVDHARTKTRIKRGRGTDVQRMDTDQLSVPMVERKPAFDVLDIDSALNELALVDERMAHVMELHYFGGMTTEEIGFNLHISEATVSRDLRLAKAWLLRELRNLQRLHPSTDNLDASPDSPARSIPLRWPFTNHAPNTHMGDSEPPQADPLPSIT